MKMDREELIMYAEQFNNLREFIDNVGLQDWMYEYINTPEGEPITEDEIKEINDILEDIWNEAKDEYQKKVRIMKTTGMTDYDIKHHLKDGTYIYEAEDYIKFFDEYTDGMDDEYKEKLKKMLENKEKGHIGDADITEYNSKLYYIEYCL